VFYMAADDNAVLYLSTDEDPAHKVLIATEPEWGGFREWTGNAGGRRDGCTCNDCDNISSPIPLQAGCKYYAELIYKEGGGGDYGSVAWRLAGEAPPANGSEGIAAANISPYTPPGPPVENGNPPTIVQAAGSTMLLQVTVTYNEAVDPTTAADPFNYGVTDGVNSPAVEGAALLSDGKTVVLTLSAGTPLALDTLYTVTATGISDVAGNVNPSQSATFHSVVEGCGGIIFEAYNAGGGALTCQLTSHPTFPNNPARTGWPHAGNSQGAVPWYRRLLAVDPQSALRHSAVGGDCLSRRWLQRHRTAVRL